MNMRFNKIFSALLFLSAALTGVEARVINVHGRVTAKHNGEPLSGVCVFNGANNKLLGSTNDEGKYMVSIDDAGELMFEVLGSQDLKVAVGGRLNIDVALEREAMVLDEVVVQAKRVTSAILTEPTDMDVKGNYLHIKTHVKMPHEMFNTSSRLIVQPMIYNVTRKQVNYLSPVVYDGWRYAYTQERMHDFDRNKDPLSPKVEIKRSSSRKDNVITIIDSAFVEHPKDDFRCDLLLSVENYNRIVYGDTATIARGVVNPLRFLELDLDGLFVTDSAYLPTPDLQLRDTRGDIKLTFKVNQAKLDLDLENNRAELENLLSQIHEIEQDPNSTLKSFTIEGTASPEGSYNFNLGLAKKRMESAMATILENLDPSTKRNAEFNSDASVEKWASVIEMLKADSLVDEAAKVEEIVGRFPENVDRQSQQVVRQPFYTKIKENYLPRLRKVNYEFVSSRYRYLTDEEIAEEYKKNSGKLSRYEYWRLYTLTDSLPEKEEICRRALEADPKFLVAASDLTAMMIQRGHSDPSILAPLVEKAGNHVPDEARATLAAAYLNDGNFIAADSLAEMLPDNERFHKTIVYGKALNGKYVEVMQELSEESLFNEVLLLLAIKANDQAWEKAQQLGNTAKEEYVKAMAANRVDEYMEAVNHLENAFELDPDLKEIAKVDGDVIDLLDDENE